MTIVNSCFLSYPHPKTNGSYLDKFVRDLAAELDERLDGFLGGKVYVDKHRLLPTYNYDEALRDAICRSTCMVVVYCPEYKDREYCRREFDLIERINIRRRERLLGKAGPRNFAALVSLSMPLPQRLRETSWHIADFSKYESTYIHNGGARRIRRSEFLHAEVVKLAQAVRELNDLVRGEDGFGTTELCCGEDLAQREAVGPWSSHVPYPR